MDRTIIAVAEVGADRADCSIIQSDLPTLIKGGCKDWDASHKWTIDFFKKEYGQVEVPLNNYKKDPYQTRSEKSKISLGEYLDREKQDEYCAGWTFRRQYPQLFMDTKIPSYFSENWLERIQHGISIDGCSLFFGHPSVDSPLHTDSFFVSVWLAVVRGKKRIRLISPKDTPYVCNGDDIFDQARTDELLKNGVRIYDCTIEEGDIVWIPPGWWHHVINETFTIALSTNFVSSYHFLPFEQQVRAALMKPLLMLSKIKRQCLEESTKSSESFAGLHHSRQVLNDSKFIELEESYLKHFSAELEKTSQLIEFLSAQRGPF